MENPKSKYEEKLTQLTVELKKTQQKLNTTVILRVGCFVLAFVNLWLFWGAPYHIHWVLFVALIAIFLWLVRRFESLRFEKNYLKVLVEINENELKAIEGNFNQFPNGKEFADPLHPFAADLDLFGEGSIFQYINRSGFSRSKQVLANLLKQPLTHVDEIIASQEGIKELTQLFEFRQDLHARIHFLGKDEEHTNFLSNWSEKQEATLTNGFTKIAIWVIPAAMFVVLGLQIFDVISFSLAIYFYLIPLFVTGVYLKKISAEHGMLGKVTEGLNALENAINTIENQQFEAKYLNDIKAPFVDGVKASKAIEALKKLSGYFDQRSNFLVGIFLNVFLLWDIRLSIQLEKWKKQYGNKINAWLQGLSHFEVAAQLANLNYNRADLNFPEPNTSTLIKAHELGHPLLLNNRVNNNLEVATETHVVVLTGANMAGKSTFLRTLGVNLILGQIGAPVCAKSMSFPILKLYSGMRTTDSLQENASYFFAELKRLSAIVNALEKGEKLFILLDEILKGTNSKDKEEGSKKLIKRLLDLKAGAIVATHDLGLCKLESEFPKHITNMAFETEIKDNELYFDYKLKRGVCQTMNASFLMEKMGITSSPS